MTFSESRQFSIYCPFISHPGKRQQERKNLTTTLNLALLALYVSEFFLIAEASQLCVAWYALRNSGGSSRIGGSRSCKSSKIIIVSAKPQRQTINGVVLATARMANTGKTKKALERRLAALLNAAGGRANEGVLIVRSSPQRRERALQECRPPLQHSSRTVPAPVGVCRIV